MFKELFENKIKIGGIYHKMNKFGKPVKKVEVKEKNSDGTYRVKDLKSMSFQNISKEVLQNNYEQISESSETQKAIDFLNSEDWDFSRDFWEEQGWRIKDASSLRFYLGEYIDCGTQNIGCLEDDLDDFDKSTARKIKNAVKTLYSNYEEAYEILS